MRLFVVLSLLLAFEVGAQAVTTINFAGGTTGSISYTPGISPFTAAPLVGTGINIETITGNTDNVAGTPLVCSSCVLNFTSGLSTGVGGQGLTQFGGGGTFTITGGIASLGIAAGSTLLSGQFSNTEVLPDSTNIVSGTQFNRAISATVINVIHAGISSHFGLFSADAVYQGSYSQSFQTLGDTDQRNGFASTSLLQGNVLNTAAVPEPSHILLSTTAAGILAIVIRRRRTA